MTSPLFRIGARGSALSLAQTRGVRAALAVKLGMDEAAIEIVAVTTSGDKQQDGRLIEAGGKGLFTKELDEALLGGRIDFAVHSLKDLPTKLPDGIALAATPAREDPRDAFVSPIARTLAALPAGAVVGTASLRRQAQTLFARRDISVVVLRGNVDTRLRKLSEGAAHATYLALAGLKRLGLADRATSIVEASEAPPAPGQGALAITARADDARVRDALALLEDAATRLEISAERAFLAALDGSCRTAIAALARRDGASLAFIGEALAPDGAQRWRREATLALGEDARAAAEALGAELGAQVRDEAGDALVTDL
jgi:hydroxymethylbilane synthase